MKTRPRHAAGRLFADPSEAYLEVRKTSQTHISGLLTEEAHEYCVRFFTLFPFFFFRPKPTSKSGKRRISSTIASLAEEAHEYSARFFTLFSVFLFSSEAYLEVRKTSQTHISGLLAEEAHEYCVRFFTLFPFSVFRFSSEADKGSDYRAVTGGTARYLL